jgi:hypothetical protein
VAGKRRKDVSEMLGDFFRDAAVLVLVFYPLEMARRDNGDLPLPFVLIVGCACIACLMMGIVLEKMGG